MEAAASYRSGMSLLRQVEQMPSAIESALFHLVQRDNADTDELRARNPW